MMAGAVVTSMTVGLMLVSSILMLALEPPHDVASAKALTTIRSSEEQLRWLRRGHVN